MNINSLFSLLILCFIPLTTNATLRGAASTNVAANRRRLQQTVGTSCTILVAELLEIPGEELPWDSGDSTSFGKFNIISYRMHYAHPPACMSMMIW